MNGLPVSPRTEPGPGDRDRHWLRLVTVITGTVTIIMIVTSVVRVIIMIMAVTVQPLALWESDCRSLPGRGRRDS